MASALVLHLWSAVVWVGGMFFAYMVMRPVAAELLQPPQRLTLWVRVFTQFFRWVSLAVLTLLLTGVGMMFGVFGGMARAPWYAHIMMTLGIFMMLIFGHVRFAPYRRLCKAVAAQDWTAGGKHLGQIRRLVGLNLILGLVTIAIAGIGRMGL